MLRQSLRQPLESIDLTLSCLMEEVEEGLILFIRRCNHLKGDCFIDHTCPYQLDNHLLLLGNDIGIECLGSLIGGDRGSRR